MATKRSNAYAKLKTETSEENEEDLYDAFKNFPPLKPAERDPRFESQLIKRTPWREIVLAVFLLMMGTSMYVVALLCHYGHIHPKRVSVSRAEHEEGDGRRTGGRRCFCLVLLLLVELGNPFSS
mmetsp:Transcript_31991/g.69113  ORF Transcript_31991/g.69113 Transcript_31991/m.69113 type:complete len:124 (+) Transcript_31991:23-394(+)